MKWAIIKEFDDDMAAEVGIGFNWPNDYHRWSKIMLIGSVIFFIWISTYFDQVKSNLKDFRVFINDT